MIALLGPVPPVLIQRERDMRQRRWSPELLNPEGKLCGNAAEFYGRFLLIMVCLAEILSAVLTVTDR
jgi:hypothetical protein